MDNIADFQAQAQAQPRPQGLHVTPLPPKKPSAAWKVVRWLIFVVLTVVCVVSVLFNLFFSSGLASGAGRSQRITERHISGSSGLTAAAKVAIVTVDDVIVGTEESGPASWILLQLQRAQDDSKVKAIVLDVDSPGGGITASDIIHQKIRDLQDKGKSVVVIMRDVAASGAYYISAPADRIIAHPTTITGSIGVLISGFNVEGLFQKIGVQSVVFKSGLYKDLLSPYRPVTQEERDILQDITDQMFERFKEVVADGRGLSPDEVDAISTGAIFTAKDALERKLIDEIGYFEDAVDVAREATGAKVVSNVEVVRYQQPPSVADMLFGARTNEADLQAQLAKLVESRRPGFYYLWPGP